MNTEYGKYITLSHCRGQNAAKSPTTTTTATLQARKRGLTFNEICPLFQDVFSLVRMSGYRYIWIDSLCIVQDDESDWQVQSMKMADIYAGSFLNIATTYAPDSSHRLFVDRYFSTNHKSTFPVQSFKLIADNKEKSEVHIRQSHTIDHEYICGDLRRRRWQYAPLLDRAWVLQERLLARRTLHFTLSELVWECNCSYACECIIESETTNDCSTSGEYAIGARASVNRLYRSWTHEFSSRICQSTGTQQSSLGYLYYLWLKLASNYSSLLVTKPLDRYYALAGLAQMFQRVTKDQYLAGLWARDLSRSLLWTGGPRSSPSTSRSKISPTWSWISRVEKHDGGTDCSMSYSQATEDFIQDIRVRIHQYRTFSTIMSGSEFGPVSGQIVIEGAFLPVFVTKERDDFRSRNEYYLDLGLGPQGSHRRCLLWADCPQAEGEELEDGDMVQCLLLGTSKISGVQHFLVLREHGRDQDRYHLRVGVAEFERTDNDFSDAAVGSFIIR